MATMKHPIQSSLLIKQYISTYSQHSSHNVSSHRMNTTLHKNLIAKRFIINNLSNKFSWTCKESKRAWHLDNIHTGMHYTKKNLITKNLPILTHSRIRNTSIYLHMLPIRRDAYTSTLSHPVFPSCL